MSVPLFLLLVLLAMLIVGYSQLIIFQEVCHWSAFHLGVASIRQSLPENSITGTLQLSATCTRIRIALPITDLVDTLRKLVKLDAAQIQYCCGAAEMFARRLNKQRGIEMLNQNSFMLPCLLAALVVSPCLGQDYTTMTLDFENITSTNVNQTVSESSSNEKEVEFGDYDNDGDLDVVIAVGSGDFGQRRNKLYRNDMGVLNEVSGAPVISGFGFTDTSRNAFFRDFDGDGDLDIIITNDSNSGDGGNDSPGKTKLFRNDEGIFVNDTGKLGGIRGAACGGVSADFDNDGDPDLMLCNYPGPSQDALGRNNNGQMQIITNTHYPAESRYGVDAATADMNGDGKLDFLVCNRTNNPSFIYYNDNMGLGSEVGDFRYSGSEYLVPDSSGGVNENAMEPCDFDGDGRMDFYYANAGTSGNIVDLLYINQGNDASNKATFATQTISSSLNNETYKVTCNDLDGDGKPDLLIMGDDRRPYIFRNTSENGDVSFIEWTPAVIPSGSSLSGWHMHSADVTGNGRPDVLVGAFNDDHLFENVNSSITDADDLSGGQLPAFHNAAPIAILGGVEGNGGSETYIASGIPSGARVSILLRSTDDLSLDVVQNGSSVASSSRPGADVDEAVEFVKSGSANLEITITNHSPARLLGDANGDGTVDLLDVNPFINILTDGIFDPALDMNADGSLDLLDVAPFINAISNGGAGTVATPFVLECLSRSG